MNEILAELMAFVDHKDRCDFVQPMWHKGPCDCGLFALFEQIHKHTRDSATAFGRALGPITNSDAYKRWMNRGEHER